MKKLYVLAFCQLLIANCFTQGFNWQWAKAASSAPTRGYQEGLSVACNPAAGVYFSGYFDSTAIFGGDTIFSTASNYHFYLARYDGAGNAKWAKTQYATGASLSQATGLAIDGYSNACLTGWFLGNLQLTGNINLVSSGGNSGFTAKYDTSGNVLWAIGNNGAANSGIATDLNNNIYITGFYNLQVTIGDTTFTNPGGENSFLAKLDSAGNLLWAQPIGGTGYAQSTGVATDNAGNIYVTGIINSNSFGIGDSTVVLPADVYTQEVFLARFNTSGNLIWVTTSTQAGASELNSYSVAVDANQSAYITGYYTGDSLTFQNTTLYINSGNPQYVSTLNAFLVKYDSLGQLQYAKSAAGVSNSYGYGLAIDTNNNVYLSGAFNYLVSTVADSIFFNTTLLTLPLPQLIDPSFIFEFDAAGNVLNAQAFTSGGDDQNAICIDRLGNGYFGGDFFIVDSMYIGNNLLTRTGGENGYIAKFSGPAAPCNISPPSITASSNSICANDSTQICAPAGFTTYMWNSGQTGECFYTGTAGNYYVTVVDNNNCTAVSDTVTISVNALPQVSINADTNVICANDSVQICATAGFVTYNWSGGETGTCFYTNQSGSYTVSVTDNNGCTAGAAGVTITVNPLPQVTVTANADTICANDSTQICATAGLTTYQWSTGQSGACFYTGQAESYYVSVTDQNSCTAVSLPLILTVNPLPQVSFSWDSLNNPGYFDTAYFYHGFGDSAWWFNCWTHVFAMSGGSPPGGVYSGGGVLGDTIYPGQYFDSFPQVNADTIIYTYTSNNGCSNSAFGILLLGICEGIQQTAVQNTISIYPNPSNGNWQLAISNNLIGVAFEVWDATGKIVHIPK